MSITAITQAVSTVTGSTSGRVAIASGKAIGWTFIAIKANSEASRNFLNAATTLDAALKAKTEGIRENWHHRTSKDVAA